MMEGDCHVEPMFSLHRLQSPFGGRTADTMNFANKKMEQSEAGAKSQDIQYVMENNGRRGKWRVVTDGLD